MRRATMPVFSIKPRVNSVWWWGQSSRIPWLGRLAALVCLLVSGGLVHGAERPNVVVFLVDDMGLMDTSVPMLTGEDGQPERYALNEWYRTPNMAMLADRGIRFSTFYANSVCSPTRISILTGQASARHGTTQWISPTGNNRGKFGPPDWNWTGLSQKKVTLPRLLSEAGYRTIHVGKAHLGPLDHAAADPTNVGFDVNVGGAPWGRPRSYYGQDHYGNAPKYDNKHHNVPDLEPYHDTDTYLTEALTREANQRLEQAVKDDKPFFLHMAHYAVHSPFQSDPRFAPHYARSDKNGNAKNYATMIEGVDKSLGDILAKLRQLGEAEDTVIFFLGDNGSDAPLGGKYAIASSAPLRGKKATHYEGGMRVPFIAAWAKPRRGDKLQQRLPIAAGAIQTQTGTIMDLFPTILALARVEAPASHAVDGKNLKPLLTGQRVPAREESFLMHFPHGHRSSYFTSLRLGDWKLVYHYQPGKPGEQRYELYNLAKDRDESQNLAKQKPAQLKRLVREMRSRLEARGAHYPVGPKGEPVKPQVPGDG